MKPKLTQEQVRKLFDYDEDTGILTWRESPNQGIDPGSEAGTMHHSGYLQTRMNGHVYLNHVIVWIWLYDYYPEHTIDHKNRIRHDNKKKNLREATVQCQRRNSTLKPNTSGVRGVSIYSRDGKWQPQIKVNKKNYNFGRFNDLDEAVCYRLAAEQCLNWYRCDSNSPALKYVKENINASCR